MGTMTIGLEPKRTREEVFVQQLKSYDSGTYFVLNLVCCTQKILVENDIHIINFYSGWQSDQTPQFTNPETGMLQPDLLFTVHPKYVSASAAFDFSKYSYVRIINNNVGSIWKTDLENIHPD